MRNRRRGIAVVIGVASVLAAGAGPPRALGQTAAQRGAPVAGDYRCLKSRYSHSPVSGPAGPLLQLSFDPSAIGPIRFDGKGGYVASKKPGRYRFDAATGAFEFLTGPLAGWPAVFRIAGGMPLLRLAATKDDALGATGRVGEHTCRRAGAERFADSAPVRAGDPTAPRNAGARGTLTFRESWGSNSIVDVDLASGAVVTRFEGVSASRGASGETVFTNKQGALVIGGADGKTAATIPVREKDGHPDLAVLSPDGSRVAYHVNPIYHDSRVLVVTRDGRLLAEFKDVTEPDWTPDGRLVMAKDMSTRDSKPGIYISDPGLKTLTRVDPNLDNARWPSVSPDGTRLAFVHHGHVWVMGLDGSGLAQLTTSDTGEERPGWSPDGRRLVAAQRQYGTVLLISADDGTITKLTNTDGRTMQSTGRITWR